jgi:hypothetical protein
MIIVCFFSFNSSKLKTWHCVYRIWCRVLGCDSRALAAHIQKTTLCFIVKKVEDTTVSLVFIDLKESNFYIIVMIIVCFRSFNPSKLKTWHCVYHIWCRSLGCDSRALATHILKTTFLYIFKIVEDTTLSLR